VTLPYLTSALAGTGGTLRTNDDDFVVDEELPYAPSGAGDHVFVRIEKRGLTTLDAVRALARALGVRDRDVGVAGMKDRRAVTRQWLSLPPPVAPEQALAAALPDDVAPALRVLEAHRHPHKLRTGHVRANRFVLRVRGVDAGACDRARKILAALSQPPGAPNWYGEQRFGKDGDNGARQGTGHRRTPARPRPPARSADDLGAAIAAVQRLARRPARRRAVPQRARR